MNRLKSCPFCGGEAEFERKGTNKYSTIVRCTNCGAELEDGSTFNHEENWNTRTSPEGGVSELHKIAKRLHTPHDREHVAKAADTIQSQQAEIERKELDVLDYQQIKFGLDDDITELKEVRDQLQARVKELEGALGEIVSKCDAGGNTEDDPDMSQHFLNRCKSIAKQALATKELDQGSEWQPIETAPKKEYVLVWGLGMDDEVQEEIFVNTWVARLASDDWWECIGNTYVQEPTHWMPLPPKPEGV